MLPAAVAALAGLLVALVSPAAPRFGDARDYQLHAEALCQGTYPARVNPPFVRAPGLPALIAVATGCEVERTRPVKLGLAVAHTATTVLVLTIAWLVWERRSVALAAGLLAALWPPFLGLVADLYSEPLAAAFQTAAVVGVLLAWRSPSPWTALGLGSSLALAALSRPSALVLVPVALALGAAGVKREARGRFVLFAVLGMTVGLGPWAAFTTHVYGTPMLVNDAGPYNLWRGVAPEMREAYHAPDAAAFRAAADRFEREVSPRAATEVAARAAARRDRGRLWLERFAAVVRADPWGAARFMIEKAVRFWRPWLDPRVYGTRLAALSATLWVPLYLAAGLGLVRLLREGRREGRLAAAWLAAAWLGHVPFQVVARFRLPWVEPWALVLAVGWLAGSRSKPRPPGGSRLEKRSHPRAEAVADATSAADTQPRPGSPSARGLAPHAGE